MRDASSTSLDRSARRAVLVASVPAATLLLVLACSWLGVSLTGPAIAATTDSGTIEVTGSVDKLVSLDPTSCTGPALVLGTLTPGDPWAETATSCDISFGSNNSSLGADLQVLEDPTAGPGAAMKCISICSAGSTIADVAAGGVATASAPSSAFGMRATAAAGAATAVWAPATTAFPVGDTADTACQTSSATTGTCSFRFGGRADEGTDEPGSYRALVRVVAQAR